MILITGGPGQDALILGALAVRNGISATISARDPEALKRGSFILPEVDWVLLDILDEDACDRTVQDIAPEIIFNLAGRSSVAESWLRPSQALDVNVKGTVNLLWSTVRFAPHARFWQASSSEIFERGVQKISAQAPRRAGSPYGQTKIQADAWVGFFRDTYNLDAASVIAFNHESPLRPLGFVWKVIQSQFEQNKEGPLTVRLNNPNSAKDWGWAPDYMDALLKTRKLASATDLVLASGRLTPLGEVVQQFAHKYNVQTFDIIETGSERQNDSEHPFGDISKTTELIDWAPTTSLSEAVSFMVDYSDLNATEGERLSIHREWIASLMAKAGEVS